MNSLIQRVARQRFAICCQLLHPTRRVVDINFWKTSCRTCQTHVGKRASHSSTRTRQKRWFDFRFLRFRSSVLRVGRARGNQARQLNMGQRPALQCGAVGTCCSRGLDIHQNMFIRCRRGKQFVQFFKLSQVLGRTRIGSCSLLICSTSEASAVERVREKSLRTFPAQTEQFGRRDIRGSITAVASVCFPDAQANHIYETCRHLKL